jgi:chemotaxis protein MotB
VGVGPGGHAGGVRPVHRTRRGRDVHRRGVGDPGKGERSTTRPEETEELTDRTPDGARRALSGPADHDSASNISETWLASDQNLFADPYAVLAEIARDTGTMQNISNRGDGGAQAAGPASGASGGESYRDPFAPDFWSRQVSAPEVTSPLETVDEANTDLDGPRLDGPAKVDPELAAVMAPAPEVVERVEVVEVQPDEEVPTPRTEQLAREMRAELADIFGDDDRLNETLEIVPRRSGVMISLTDEFRYGMFEIGSAVPQRQLVLAMERIGAALDARVGRVIVIGHTDGRPFRSADYDNWRLSSARAHAAYYMLVRGGLEEARVKEIAGHADRALKVPDDPYADANRRIEIFLEVD